MRAIKIIIIGSEGQIDKFDIQIVRYQMPGSYYLLSKKIVGK